MTQQIAIVGYGFAGQRMDKVLAFARQQNPNRFSPPVLIDEKLGRGVIGESSVYPTLEQAMEAHAFDAAIVAVNEERHFDVLSQLVQSGITRILCEKPLTSTLEDALRLKPQLSNHLFTMNMVERFSPVFDDFFSWQETMSPLRATRVQLFWGKDRIRDKRPTMGVLSEVIHPLDIASYAFGFNGFTIQEGFVHHSDFSSCPDKAVADTLHCKLVSDTDCVVSAHASFAWMERRREMFAHLVSQTGCYIVHFQFDMPRWDCDRLRIYEVSPSNGQRMCLFDKSYTNADFPPELDQLNKVYSFVLASLEAAEPTTQKPMGALVNLDQAIKLQALLNQLEVSLEGQSDTIHEKLMTFEAEDDHGIA